MQSIFCKRCGCKNRCAWWQGGWGCRRHARVTWRSWYRMKTVFCKNCGCKNSSHCGRTWSSWRWRTSERRHSDGNYVGLSCCTLRRISRTWLKMKTTTVLFLQIGPRVIFRLRSLQKESKLYRISNVSACDHKITCLSMPTPIDLQPLLSCASRVHCSLPNFPISSLYQANFLPILLVSFIISPSLTMVAHWM